MVRRSAITLIELLVVIAIIAILIFSSNARGVFMFGNAKVTLLGITDGSSKTAALCEGRKGDFNIGVVTPETDLMTRPGSPTTPDQAVAICNSFGATNPLYQW